MMEKNLDNSFDKPVGVGAGGGGDLDQMESSELFKASQDSFAQFAASGDFCFDTQRCDWNELQASLEKDDVKAIEKFDFQLLIQTQENIDEFPQLFGQFLQSHQENIEQAKMTILLTKVVKSILQSYPGLYRETVAKMLEAIDGKLEVL